MIAIIKLRVFFLVRVQTGEQSRSGARRRLILKMTRKETAPPPAALAAAPTRDAGTQTAEPVEGPSSKKIRLSETEDDLTSSEESDTSSEEEDNQDDDGDDELFVARVLGLTLGQVKFPHSRKR